MTLLKNFLICSDIDISASVWRGVKKNHRIAANATKNPFTPSPTRTLSLDGRGEGEGHVLFSNFSADRKSLFNSLLNHAGFDAIADGIDFRRFSFEFLFKLGFRS